MDKPERRDIRLRGYDYSRNGAYFVTVCTQNRQHYFWDYYQPVGGDAHIAPHENDVYDISTPLPYKLTNIGAKMIISKYGDTSKTTRQIGKTTNYSAKNKKLT